MQSCMCIKYSVWSTDTTINCGNNEFSQPLSQGRSLDSFSPCNTSQANCLSMLIAFIHLPMLLGKNSALCKRSNTSCTFVMKTIEYEMWEMIE